ncbi:MAG: hypothetical protein WAM85_09390, partial [Terracidiphilus sp.]
MNSQLQPVQQDTASLRLVASPWPESKGTFSRLRLRPEIARGLAGRVTQVADLCLLSLTLIYFALWAVEARPATDPLALLSMRISIAHFCVLAFCWMMWRAIFFYCGLYEWQHIRQVRSLSGRIVLASGICALANAQIISAQWHHGHFLRIVLYSWLACALGATASRAAIGVFHIFVRPHLRRTRFAVIVGTPGTAARASNALMSHANWKYKIL